MHSAGSAAKASPVLVTISNGPTKSADEWAREITDKILTVGDTAPQPIRDQAIHFRNQIFVCVRDNLAVALEQEREWASKQLIRG